MTISTTKGTDLMNSLVLSQYRNSPNFLEYMQAFVDEMDLLFYEVENVYLGRFLENAEGAQLDVIGRILNEPRDVAISNLYFGFSDNGSPPGGVAGFASETSPADGGIFLSENQAGAVSPPLSDVTYRRLLQAKGYLLSNKTLNADTAYNAISILLGRTVRDMRLLTGGYTEYYNNPGAVTDYDFTDTSQRDLNFSSNVGHTGGMSINFGLVNQFDSVTTGKVGSAFDIAVEVGQEYDVSFDYDNTNIEPSDYARMLIVESSSQNVLYDSGNVVAFDAGTVSGGTFTSTESNITYYLFIAGIGNASTTPGAYISYSNIIFSYDEAGSVELEVSSSDVTSGDQAFIQYFSKYFIPMGTNFFVTRI